MIGLSWHPDSRSMAIAQYIILERCKYNNNGDIIIIIIIITIINVCIVYKMVRKKQLVG